MKLFILVALVAAGTIGAVVQGQPVGTIGHGACGVFTDQNGMSLPAGPGVIKANGNCKTDLKGYHPHQPSFEACVALIKAEECTMAKYISYGAFYKGGHFSESMCAWFSECDFAHLCADPSKDSGPQCPTTKWTTDINFTSIVVAPWKPSPAPPPKPGPAPPPKPGPGPPPKPGPGPPPPKPPPPPTGPPPISPPGPERPGMIYNGTCLDGGGAPNGGDCNAMRSGSFLDGTIHSLEDCVATVKQCKYGNYATFAPPGGAFACGWSENCPTLGTPAFCVDCSKPKQPNGQPSVQCKALTGRCPAFVQFYTEVVNIGPGPHPPLPNFTCSTPPPPPGPGPPPPPPTPPAPPPPATGTPWEPVGPWNIFDDKDNKGEAGTLAAAASPEANPNIIYAGGHNNGVSSGILKSMDGGSHWTKNSSGIWDTRIYGVFIHPSDPTGNHVLVGTGTGIYETKDGAASWQLVNETEGFGVVISFAETTIGGKQYISANHGSSISSVPVSGGLWQTAAAPGVTWSSLMSTVTTAGKSEVMMCIAGTVMYGAFDTPTSIQWTGPVNYTKQLYQSWTGFQPDEGDQIGYAHRTYDGIYDSCSCTGGCHGQPNCTAHCTCTGHWHYLGHFPNVTACETAAKSPDLGFKPAAFTYKGNVPGPGVHPPGQSNKDYIGQCFASDNFATWTPPHGASQWDNQTVKGDIGQSYSGRGIGVFPVNSTKTTCKLVAVDPNDRNHFMYSDTLTNYNWDSHDGGATVRQMGMTGDNTSGTGPHNHGTFYVAIDGRGWSYSASMGGAFVSRDNGTSFAALHMVATPRGNAENATEWPVINRVNHDYQGISTNFGGDGVAFPSDQGLGIVDGNSNTLINAVGDMHNNMALSALISPSKDGKSRNIVVNLWDWNQAFTIDDGATWRGWAASEAAPYTCGEGGWGFSLGKSGHVLMFHHSYWWYSGDGGYNFVQNTFPGSGGLGLAYVRKAGSLTEPNGTVFSLMKGPAGPSGEFAGYDKSKAEREHEEHVQEKLRLADPTYRPAKEPSVYSWLLTSENFGLNFTYKVLPDKLQTCGALAALGADPTTPNSLYFLSDNCLAHSTDYGISWSSCITAPGLEGPFLEDSGALLVKNSKIMFVMRVGKVPLKTVDGGATWKPMTSLASLYQANLPGGTPTQAFKGELSWTGKTLVVYGADRSAIQRHEFGTKVWKSTDEGETWTDETGDLATISVGHGRWYESDFYIVTQGQGVIAKRNFE